MFAFTSRQDVYDDAMPYMQENIEKTSLSSKVDHMTREKLWAYEVLRTLDPELLRLRDEVQLILTANELFRNADMHMQLLYQYASGERT